MKRLVIVLAAVLTMDGLTACNPPSTWLCGWVAPAGVHTDITLDEDVTCTSGLDVTGDSSVHSNLIGIHLAAGSDQTDPTVSIYSNGTN